MGFFDLPLEQLEKYQASMSRPTDFDQFWKRTLTQTAAAARPARFQRVADPIYNLVDVQDVTFSGFMGQDVRGWFIQPKGNRKKLPCLVTYLGYGGGRSLPVDHLAPAVAGFANFVMDTRGQGSGWTPGDTADDGPTGPQTPGFMTRGIDSPETYYYRRVFADAVRAVDTAASHENVDPRRIGVTGGSQGGGIAIAAAGLCGKKVKLLMPDVPFLCHYRRATTIVDSMPYGEIAQYLKVHRHKVKQVLGTLDYFDGINFAPKISARALFSVALMDTTCPPSTVYAAYNRIRGKKEIRVYTYNNHEGGGVFHVTDKLRFAAEHL